MRRIGNIIAGGLTVGLVVAAAVVTAAPSDVRTGPDLLEYCPALETGSGCPEAATSFLQAANPSDGQIIELVIKIAEEADQPSVPMSICLDAAEGLRVLAGGTSDGDRKQQILDIADALCQNSATGAIGDDVDEGGGTGTGDNGAGGQTSSSQLSEPISSSSSQPSDPSSVSSSMSSSEPATDNCAGNSPPTNGNNCDNPNNSHKTSSSSSAEASDCAGNSTPKNGRNCDNPNNS